jgi:hypothetical protein
MVTDACRVLAPPRSHVSRTSDFCPNPDLPRSVVLVPPGSLTCTRLAGSPVLRWTAISGRVYSVWCITNLLEGFEPLDGATNLPWTIQSLSLTNVPSSPAPGAFYRLEVWKP